MRIRTSTLNTVYLIVYVVSLLGVSCLQAPAQCPSQGSANLDVNQVNATINNSAELFWDLNAHAGYAVPKSYDRHATFASSLWVGGLDPMGGLHVAASTYRQQGDEFYAGPYRHQTPYNCGRGIETPAQCLVDGALWLSSGKVMHILPGAFQVFDPVTGTKVTRYLPPNFLKLRALELPSGQVAIIWWHPTQQAVRSQIMVIDTSNFLVPVSDTLLYNHQEGSMVVLPNGNVLLIGPFGVEEFNPVTHTTQARAARGSAVVRQDAVVLGNGWVFATGGPANGTELYDPLTDTWQPGPSLLLPRTSYPELTALPGGDILITGGNVHTAATEIYDPLTNSITAGPVLADSMGRHAVHLASPHDVVFIYEDQVSFLGRPMHLDLLTGISEIWPLNGFGLPSAGRGGQIVASTADPLMHRFLDLGRKGIQDARWQHVWKVSRSDVTRFQYDFAHQIVNFASYPDIETWPGNGNVWAGEDAQLAPYIDVDGDGVYDPLQDGDYPCFPGDQALWWVFNDDGPHGTTGAASFPIQVEIMAYAFDCNNSPCPDTAVDYTTFYHYEITNKAAMTFHDVSVGIWRDPAIGYSADDIVGCDSTLDVAFMCNGDANDETAQGYGTNPPALGSFLLRNGDIDEMSGMMVYQNDWSIAGNPTTGMHHYGYLNQLWQDGSPLEYAQTGIPTHFAYPGDPGWCGPGTGNGGWSQYSTIGNQPYNQRLVQTFGPFDLDPGQTKQLDLALVFSRADFNDNLGSVCKLLDDGSTIQNWWQNVLDRGCFSLVMDAPEPSNVSLDAIQIVPNPNTGFFSVQFGKPSATPIAVRLLNLQGQYVVEESISAGQAGLMLDCSSLPSGVYLLQLTGKNLNASRKVVLQR